MKNKNPNDVPAELQRTVLSLLLFNDEHCSTIRQSIPLEAWGSADRGVKALIDGAYSWIDAYRTAPGSHVSEIVYGANLPQDAVIPLLEMTYKLEEGYPKVNIKHTMSKLEKFHRQSILHQAILAVNEKIVVGEIEQVEDILNTALRTKLSTFDRGTTALESLERLMHKTLTNSESNDRVLMGVKALDDRGIQPTRGEMLIFGGSTGIGKSFALVHCGVQALMEGKRVLYVTLELPKDKVALRFIKSWYGLIERKRANAPLNRLRATEKGFEGEAMPNFESINNFDIQEKIYDRMKGTPLQKNLIIKEFPADTLTPAGLCAYLDSLLVQEDFEPDEIIVDYGKLMYLNPKMETRLAIGSNYVALRRIATERNVAMVTAVQLNRSALKEHKADKDSVSEDYSITNTADIFITINQTEGERTAGTARLFLSKVRNEEGGLEVIIVMNYAVAQFVTSSVESSKSIRSGYDKLVKVEKPEEEEPRKFVPSRKKAAGA